MEKTAQMEVSWRELLKEEFEKPYMKELEKFLADEFDRGVEIYPPFENIFEAFRHSSFENVRVVIIGQDPYHGKGQAHGLSFSVPKGVPLPPSLQNIFKELKRDLGVPTPTHGSLVEWAEQGVMLLNAGLTVRAGEAKSHAGRGWEKFTDRVVQLLCERKDPLVFLLWGKSAADKVQQIHKQKSTHHLILTAPHPSPLSAYRGFFGCGHFSKTNDFLCKAGFTPIVWELH
ncbi:MAG TPA: uracil-DNA glycosylase [Chlamydiales bacterium]|nr:uracil-DNA glycosylase [Chlamydiales bacterium]